MKKLLKIIWWSFIDFKNYILFTISPTIQSKILYKKVFRKKLNLKSPKLFNEKLMWLKLNKYRNNELVTNCADKYEVRKYVESCGIKEILNDLIGVYDSVDEINWRELPEKFALKCNHGAGYNFICTDKKNANEIEIKKTIKKWMKKNYAIRAAEVQYSKINKKIICEKYIDMGTKKLPTDYKLYCFNGIVKIILVMNDRDTTTTREFYNKKWERIHLREYEGSPSNPTKKPVNLQEMINYAEKLSNPFEFVRVDLYNVNEKVIFGELTFTPTGCLGRYTEEVDKMMGEWINIKN